MTFFDIRRLQCRWHRHAGSDACQCIHLVIAFAATKLILRGGISGAQRITRHLWRMCVALFIAAASLFLGQPNVFPASVRGSFILFVPEVAVLGLMIFWLIRVRFTRRVP
jgi:hypothetical protein